MEAAQKIICLAISEKINTFQPIHICDLDKIQMLISELSPDDHVLQPYVDAGITVL